MSNFTHIVIEADNILWNQKQCSLKEAPCAVEVPKDMPLVLQEIKQSRKRLIIVTERETEEARELARSGAILEYFECVHGTNTPGEFITWPDIFRRLRKDQLINGCDINPSNTIMICSSVKSVRAASNQGFLVIGVASDEAGPAALLDAGACVVAQAPETIESAVIMLENLKTPIASSEPTPTRHLPQHVAGSGAHP